ncbi:hypothetical protein [Methylobacterium gnaphalii]|uniref:hypothetical protein n=1 Tax=Methylobacterium gnaphalii TaxID=1010610 RepID=UPI0011BEEB79|nr:hypothetical protein [Methylobacterium gnaphalii]
MESVMPEYSIHQTLRVVAMAVAMSLPVLSAARADTGEGDSALRAALHDPRLVDQQRGESAEPYSIGDPSLGYTQRRRANRPASEYTRYRP